MSTTNYIKAIVGRSDAFVFFDDSDVVATRRAYTDALAMCGLDRLLSIWRPVYSGPASKLRAIRGAYDRTPLPADMADEQEAAE